MAKFKIKRYKPKVSFKFVEKIVPDELIPGSTHIEIKGTGEVIVDGCKGVLEYDADSVRLSGSRKAIIIRGEKLDLRALGENKAVVKGEVYSVEFV